MIAISVILVIIGLFIFAVGFLFGMSCGERNQEREIECLAHKLQEATKSLEKSVKANQPKDK